VTDLQSAALEEGMDSAGPATRVRLRRAPDEVVRSTRPVAVSSGRRLTSRPSTSRPSTRGAEAERRGIVATRRARPTMSRRMVRSLAIATSVVGVFGLLLGVSAVQIELIGNQRHLDRVRSQLTASYERQYTLRREETLLRSPQDVADIATRDLGMVPPERAALVSPGVVRIGAPTTTVVAGATP